MSELVSRFRRLKMILTSIALGLAGSALIATGNQLETNGTNGWIVAIPWTELGGILVGAAVLGIWVDFLFRREQEALSDHRLRQILNQEAPAMRDAVLQAFAANHEDLERVATAETLDSIITNSLALRLHDEHFASEIYTDIRQQAVEAKERWHDANLSITLRPLPRDKRRRGDYFTATVRWEYTTIPKHAERRFLCLSDRREYAELSHDDTGTSAWFFKPDTSFKANTRAAYELLQFNVNGEARTIRRSSRANFQSYTAHVGDDPIAAGMPVNISYVYRTVTPQDGNLLFFDIEQPTRDVAITFDYTDCDLASVSVIDLIPSVRPTRTEHTPAGAPTNQLRIEIDGWTFPRSGVALVWSLGIGARDATR